MVSFIIYIQLIVIRRSRTYEHKRQTTNAFAVETIVGIQCTALLKRFAYHDYQLRFTRIIIVGPNEFVIEIVRKNFRTARHNVTQRNNLTWESVAFKTGENSRGVFSRINRSNDNLIFPTVVN